MKNLDTRYWLELALITIGLVALAWIVFVYVLPGQYPPVLPVLLLLMVAMTVTGQVVLGGLLDKKFSKFNSAFMIYKALKILVLMTFMVIYSYFNKQHAVPFLLSTGVVYLVYMLFEARSLNRQNRRQSDR